MINTIAYLIGLIVFFAIGYALPKNNNTLRYWKNVSKGKYRHMENDNYFIGKLHIEEKNGSYTSNKYAFTENQLLEAMDRYNREFEPPN